MLELSAPLAVMDLGSNSARVVVLRVGPGQHLEVLADSRAPVRLGLDSRRGSFSRDVMDAAVAVVRDFDAIARSAGAGQVVAVGTAAVREAENGPDLIARVRDETGVDLRVLTGEEEAVLAATGALQGLHIDRAAVVDLGGGSLELTRLSRENVESAVTMPLGALRLSAQFLESDPPKKDEVAALADHVRRTLVEAGIQPMGDDRLVGTGGTIRNLAKVDRHARAYPVARLHGYVLTRDRLEAAAERLASRPSARRRRMPGLSRDRADSIVGGAHVVITTMEYLEADQMIVSGTGLREGVALTALGLAAPPAERVRASSVLALAARFRFWDPVTAERRAVLVETLQTQLDADVGPKVLERLRYAALLLDVGRSLDYYRRYDHTAEIVLTADLDGFSHRKLALLAAVIKTAGDPKARVEGFAPLLSKVDRDPVSKEAVLLTMADELERRVPRDGAPEIELQQEKRLVRLRAPVFDPWRRVRLESRFLKEFGKRLVIDPVENGAS
jgi:exopolyphosphatase/guanosine-5'-triphosphate,3'-diphosphate pyrophosphatase